MAEKMKMTDAQFFAQQIVFAPLAFQAVRCMREFGLLEAVDDASPRGATLDEIQSKCSQSEYTINTLLEVGVCAGVFKFCDGRYSATKVCQCFLYDPMTKINADFVHDVCYQGMFFLKESFEKGRPEGLRVFGDWPTVYEGLSQLPEKVQKSWFAFDHFYSDNAFAGVIKIIMSKNPRRVFDVGCNTGKFEVAFIGAGFQGEMFLLDLPPQLSRAQDTMRKNGYEKQCTFWPLNVLEAQAEFPAAPDAVFMSQFLDCFSTEQIVFILKKAAAVMTETSRLYILEPFLDNQKFEAARLSLAHTSLYFTAIANGNSKMYSMREMEACAARAGLTVVTRHESISSHEYTLLECRKSP
jgi:hypothetical protein